ncbi:hypothetical protein KA107_00065 [Candidatus Pacearchaeota archaeon]|nr:hypothetical protein [Candidatus Pacearchaeota archaeon]
MTVIICAGGMRSAKTYDAINLARAYHSDGRSVRLFQPRKNTRDVIDGKPVWRSGTDKFLKTYIADVEWYTSREEILDSASNFEVFGFEEHHWYPEDYVQLVLELNAMEKTVIDVGLNYYHNGKPVPQFEELSQLKSVMLREGACAICDVDAKKGLKTLATRTQMLIDGQFPFYDSPTDVAEESGDRFGGVEKRVSHVYYPVSIKNWQVLPPRNSSLMAEYQKYFLDVKSNV